MKEVNELIRRVAEKKAEAARESADVIAINDIVFDAGTLPGEVRMEKGIEKLCALLGGELHKGYVKSGTSYAYHVRCFWFNEAIFFEESFLCLNEIPEGAASVDSREELYASM